MGVMYQRRSALSCPEDMEGHWQGKIRMKILTVPFLIIKWKQYFQFKFSAAVKAVQNYKNAKDTSVFAICLT